MTSWREKQARKVDPRTTVTVHEGTIRLAAVGITTEGQTLAEAMSNLVAGLRSAGARQELEPGLTGLVSDSTDEELRAWLTSAPPAERPSTVLARHRVEILRIADQYGARNVRVIGSIARGEDVPGSDIDLLIGYGEGFSAFDLVGLGDDLEDLLGVPIDLVTEPGLRPGRDDSTGPGSYVKTVECDDERSDGR